MEYLNKVAQRLLTPGMLILVLGAVLVYGCGPVLRRVMPEDENRRQKLLVLIKAIGCLVALVGALMVMRLI